jgi:hypothetical protein
VVERPKTIESRWYSRSTGRPASVSGLSGLLPSILGRGAEAWLGFVEAHVDDLLRPPRDRAEGDVDVAVVGVRHAFIFVPATPSRPPIFGLA